MKLDLANIVPDLARVVERYWGVPVEGCATRIKRDASASSGVFYSVFVGRWMAVKPANETEAKFLELMWLAQ